MGGDFAAILSSGGRTFFVEGDLAFFFVGGSPLPGGNRAFMAVPSDRPAINNVVGERKKLGMMWKKGGDERNEEKKTEQKCREKDCQKLINIFDI